MQQYLNAEPFPVSFHNEKLIFKERINKYLHFWANIYYSQVKHEAGVFFQINSHDICADVFIWADTQIG